MTDSFRPVWADVDLDAITANVRALREAVAPASLLAVVKADGYGHGAVPVGRACVDAGAAWLGVALVEEGVQLRDAGISARVLVLSEPSPSAAETVVAAQLTPVVYTPLGIEALAKASATHGGGEPLAVHLKVDTGMHRVGCDVRDAASLAMQIVGHSELRLEGVCTHFAVADEPEDPYTEHQIARFEDLLAQLRVLGIEWALTHASNTAGGLAFPQARYDLVRAGIGVYGIAPSAALDGSVTLQPALSVKARVSYVKALVSGEGVSYGRSYVADRDTRIATVPIGYADGVPRALGTSGGAALVRGQRCAIAGTVTMDQLMLDVGDIPVEVGDEVVLLGRQRDEEITAGEWAAVLGRIPYEVVCGISPRVPRLYLPPR